jgi:hypothetical protein
VPWLVASAVVAVLAVIAWRAMRDEPGEQERRRTAEDRLAAHAEREQRRRRLGLDNGDDEKGA